MTRSSSFSADTFTIMFGSPVFASLCILLAMTLPRGSPSTLLSRNVSSSAESDAVVVGPIGNGRVVGKPAHDSERDDAFSRDQPVGKIGSGKILLADGRNDKDDRHDADDVPSADEFAASLRNKNPSSHHQNHDEREDEDSSAFLQSPNATLPHASLNASLLSSSSSSVSGHAKRHASPGKYFPCRGCQEYERVVCKTNPCYWATCERYPEARCLMTNCGGCFPTFWLTRTHCVTMQCHLEKNSGPNSGTNLSLSLKNIRIGVGQHFYLLLLAFVLPLAFSIHYFWNKR